MLRKLLCQVWLQKVIYKKGALLRGSLSREGSRAPGGGVEGGAVSLGAGWEMMPPGVSSSRYGCSSARSRGVGSWGGCAAAEEKDEAGAVPLWGKGSSDWCGESRAVSFMCYLAAGNHGGAGRRKGALRKGRHSKLSELQPFLF